MTIMTIELWDANGEVLAVADDDGSLRPPVTLAPGRYFIAMDGRSPQSVAIGKTTTATRIGEAQ